MLARIRPPHDPDEEVTTTATSSKKVTVALASSHSTTKSYSLDLVLPPSAGQSTVFSALESTIQWSLKGYNVTIFAYGQTGTGKTHTMLGHDLWSDAFNSETMSMNLEQRGVIPRVLEYLFSGDDVEVDVSYAEIYNERVRDLLVGDCGTDAAADGAPGIEGVGAASLTPARSRGAGAFKVEKEEEEKSLEIREDRKLGIVVPGLTSVPVKSEAEVLSVLWSGARNRAMASTTMNDRSSRSHTILTVRLQIPGPGLTRRSKLNLVDLAGSERYKTHHMAQFTPLRIKELTSINQSLSTLGNCISALTKKSPSHVPYRNSKLTRLLQDSLGGNTRTTFIVALSPDPGSAEETISTLQFADRCMRVRVYATANERLSDDDPLKRARFEIERLKSLLAAAVKRGGEVRTVHVDGGGNEEELASSKAEAKQLRDENLKLAQEVSRLRLALSTEKSEKNALMTAIHEAGGSLDDMDGNHRAQLKLLSAQRNMLEQRGKDLEAVETDQEEQREWLESYHAWLRNLPVAAAGDNGGEVTLHDRLCMMETSVLLQSEELKRTKRLFLKDRDRLERALEKALDEVGERDGVIEGMTKKEKDGERRRGELEREVEGLKLRAKGMDKVKAREDEGLAKTKRRTSSSSVSSKASTRSRSVSDVRTKKKSPVHSPSSVNSVAKNAMSPKLRDGVAKRIQETPAAEESTTDREEQKQDEWKEAWDNNHGVPYYYNTRTGETVWELPSALS